MQLRRQRRLLRSAQEGFCINDLTRLLDTYPQACEQNLGITSAVDAASTVFYPFLSRNAQLKTRRALSVGCVSRLDNCASARSSWAKAESLAESTPVLLATHAHSVQRGQRPRADRHNARLTNPAARRSIRYGPRSCPLDSMPPSPVAERAVLDRSARVPNGRRDEAGARTQIKDEERAEPRGLPGITHEQRRDHREEDAGRDEDDG